jgi:hypothetical protein
MSTKTEATHLEIKLSKEVKELTKEIENLKELEFVKILKDPWRLLGLSFIKGVMVGFGSVIGATVLVALFIYLLSQISFVPIVGDFVKDIIQEIQINNYAAK